jgi:hypothetical protein
VSGKHEAEEMKEAAKKKTMKVLRGRWEARKATIVIVGEFLADDTIPWIQWHLHFIPATG